MQETPIKGFYLFFCGMCMGACDLIPGISGGTIAFIMGFYMPLLNSLKSLDFLALHFLYQRKWKKFSQKIHAQFLGTLGLGIVISIMLLASVVHQLLNHPVYRTYLYAVFLGLILASFYFCLKQIKKWNIISSLGLILGILLAFSLNSFSAKEVKKNLNSYALKINLPYEKAIVTNYDKTKKLLTGLSTDTLSQLLHKNVVSKDTLVYSNKNILVGTIEQFATTGHSQFFNPWLIFCGALAVCALLLPGISGSYLLTILGVYPLVIGALADGITQIKQGVFDLEAFEILLNLGIGIVIGLMLFSRLLSWLLKKFSNMMLATLSGFMIGAVNTVWPFWSYSYTLLPLKLEKGLQLIPQKPIWPNFFVGETQVATCLFLLSFLLFFSLEKMAAKKSKTMIRKKLDEEIVHARAL